MISAIVLGVYGLLCAAILRQAYLSLFVMPKLIRRAEEARKAISDYERERLATMKAMLAPMNAAGRKAQKMLKAEMKE